MAGAASLSIAGIPAPAGIALLAAGLATLLLVAPARRFARAAGLVAVPRADRYHGRVVPLLGGPACLLGIAAGIGLAGIAAGGLSLDRPAVCAAGGAVGLLLIGLADDRLSLGVAMKALLQGFVFLVVLLAWRPPGELRGAGEAAAAWLVLMVAVNAWNYLDHADGAFAAPFAVGAVALAAGSGVAPAVECAGLAGAALGFLVWNRPPARIFLGDAGSLPLGFLLVFASLETMDRGGSAATAAAPHALPLADMLLVSLVRIRAHNNPFRGGREHSGHRLARALGPVAVPWVLALAAAVFALIPGVASRLGSDPRSPAPLLALTAGGLVWVAAMLRLHHPGDRA